MASSMSIYELTIPARSHRPAVIRAEGRQFAATAHVRLARREEVPHVLTLIQQQAEYHGLREKCVATQANLEAGLFSSDKQQSFLHGPTVLLLELSPSSFSSPPSHSSVQQASLFDLAFPHESAEVPSPGSARKSNGSSNGTSTAVAEKSAANQLPKSISFGDQSSRGLAANLRIGNGVAYKMMLRAPINDPEAVAYRSTEGRIIGGFAMVYQKYISFEAKYGMYVEDLYVRECMRGHGFGTLLFKSVAGLAVEQDCCSVDFRVVDWNKKALKLYEGMGAKVSPEWKALSLAGDKLKICAAALPSTLVDVGIKSPKLTFPRTLSPLRGA